jgi:hypothetical protein
MALIMVDQMSTNERMASFKTGYGYLLFYFLLFLFDKSWRVLTWL